MTSVTIDKNNTQFFISISRIGLHSFIMVGIYNKNKVSQLLCRVGKTANIPEEERSCSRAIKEVSKILFSSTDAKLQDEGIFRNKKSEAKISYHAYDITYENYLDFIKVLEGLEYSGDFECLKPVRENGDLVTLKLTSKPLYPSIMHPDLRATNRILSLSDTCRHTAIKLVEVAQGRPVSSMVSSSFFVNLPCTTTLEYGIPSAEIPFYVLPIPPSAVADLPAEKMRVLERLYRQMERMLLIECTSSATRDKFNCLKDLYSELLGPQKNVTLEQLLNHIHDWKMTNATTLNVLRKTYFWDSLFTRTSATTKMIAEMEKDLQPELRV